MNTKVFECIVCLEVCQDCINCLKCNQILCKAHVNDLPRNRCPGCRDEPFLYQENVALQRVIEQMRGLMIVPNAPSPAHEEENDATTTSPPATNDADVPAQPRPGSVTPEPPVVWTREVSGMDRRQLDDNDITRYGSKVPRAPPNEDEFKKLPNQEHARKMRDHVRSCTNTECRSVWRGPWGHFIGGSRGRTHFDLTECLRGRQLNEMIGWNYEDPHC